MASTTLQMCIRDSGGTGTILAKIDAEKDNPQGDVWYGGTLDPHSQAGEMGLLCLLYTSLDVTIQAQIVDLLLELQQKERMSLILITHDLSLIHILKDHRRTLTGRTGCGICGTEQISQVYKKLPKLDHTFQFNLNLLDGCLEQLQANQALGKETGATHAAAFFDLSGHLLAIREDVERHVALDKLIGWHAKQNQPQGFILVSSRASYEMVQKSVACGIELLVAISEMCIRDRGSNADYLSLLGGCYEKFVELIVTNKEKVPPR